MKPKIPRLPRVNKKKKQRENLIVIALLFTSFAFFAFLIFRLCEPRIYEVIGNVNMPKDYVLSTQPTGDIINDTIRYEEFVLANYKYNESNLGKILDFDTLMKEGGVCTHYANLYKELAKEDGYYATTTRFQVTPNDFHRIAIISNSKATCIADGVFVYCKGWG